MDFEGYFLSRKGEPKYTIALNKEEIIVGRKFSSFLETSIHVSREHASLHFSDDGTWFLRDLHSTNGTFVNGVKVGTRLKHLNIGDSIGLGVPQAVTSADFEFILLRKPTEVSCSSLPATQCCSTDLKPVRKEMKLENLKIVPKETLTVPRPLQCLETVKIEKHEVECIELSSDDEPERPNANNAPSAIKKEKPYQEHYTVKYADIIRNQPFVVLERLNYNSGQSDSSDDEVFYNGSHSCKSRNVILDSSAEQPTSKTTKEDVESNNENLVSNRVQTESYKTVIPRKISLTKRKTVSSSESEDMSNQIDASKKALKRTLKKKKHMKGSAASDSDSTDCERGHPVSTVILNPLAENSITCHELTNILNSVPCLPVIAGVFSRGSAVELPNFPPFTTSSEISYSAQHQTAITSFAQNQMIAPTFVQNQTAMPAFVHQSTSVTFLQSHPIEANSMVKIEQPQNIENCSQVPPPPNTVPIKQEDNQVVPATNNLEEQFKNKSPTTQLNYSKEDEIIVISDDDFFAYPLSQVKNEEDVYFEQELDEVAEDEDCFPPLESPTHNSKSPEHLPLNCHQILELQSPSSTTSPIMDCTSPSVTVPSTKTIAGAEDMGEFSESISNITSYIQQITAANEKQETTHNLQSNSISTSSDSNFADFFPVLTQETVSSPSGDESSNKEGEEVPPKKYQSEKPKARLIEPMQMTYRPKYQRGKEEWFDDHCNKSNNSRKRISKVQSVVPLSDMHMDANYKTKKSTKDPKKLSTSKLPTPGRSKKVDLKTKLLKNMDHRIRMPSGGSAILKDPPRNPNRRNQVGTMKSPSPTKKTPFRIPKISRTVQDGSPRKAKNSVQKNSNLHTAPASSPSRAKFQKVPTSRIKNSVRRTAGIEVQAAMHSPKEVPRLRPKPSSNNSLVKPNASHNQVTSTTVDPRMKVRSRVNEIKPPHDMDKGTANSSAETWNQVPNRRNSAESTLLHRSVSEPMGRSIPHNQYSYDALVEKMLYWSPKWLEEYEVLGKPPTISADPLVPMQDHFSTLKDYADTFLPLILVELWENVHSDWKQYKEKCKIYTIITRAAPRGKFLELNCQSLMHSNANFIPREGRLMTIWIKELNSVKRLVFGYVTSHNLKTVDGSTSLHPEWNRFADQHSNDMIICDFLVKIRKFTEHLELNKLTGASVLCYVSNKINMTDTLVYLSSSPLVYDILKPTERTYELPKIAKALTKSVTGEYNESQRTAIASITEEINAPQAIPKMILLQGPPGTGKTHTIVGLIQNLLHGKKNKILVTTHSNAALDEIGRRLLQVRKANQHEHLRIVRVGSSAAMHPDITPCFLDTLIKSNVRRELQEKNKDLSDSYYKKIERIQKLEERLRTGVSNENIRNMVQELDWEKRQCQSLKDKINRSSYPNFKIAGLRYSILAKADIILSTLSSCRLRILEKVFGKSANFENNFMCCIVDEATQCPELEVLNPLVFKISKFVLVGDYRQLPATIYSRLAQEHQYERSLFERVHAYFKKNHSSSPVYMLDTQYRMHPEIASFPSYQFYESLLRNDTMLNTKYRGFPYHPYTVLDIPKSQESNINSSKENSLEAKVTIEVVKGIVSTIHKDYSVGIITPYQGQRNLYNAALMQHENCKHIEVNTVDSFQGREKDVIILSCVRAQSSCGSIGFLSCPKRLNVAITRAKRCLIICGNMESLAANHLWNDLITNARRRGFFQEVTSLKDMPFVLKGMRKKLSTPYFDLMR